jgi:squalene-hopene/tetraprenyl-beta-curcumene cyclase
MAMHSVNIGLIRAAHELAREALLAERVADSHWTGELSSSALATATAVSALSLVSRDQHGGLIDPGLAWLAQAQSTDGGWGDAPGCLSNLSTTLLVQSAFALAAPELLVTECLNRAESYICAKAGRTAEERVHALTAVYGEDRTFAVPILMNCALAAERGAISPAVTWDQIARLPFELAALPRMAYRFLPLGVVSYAMPALIAIGHLLHARHPTQNPVARAVRSASRERTLRRLEAIQPESGGFLEATPLTSFVTMSLAALGLRDHAVTRKGVMFLTQGARPDGSWPIDTNLSHWVTAQSLMALAAGSASIPNEESARRWILQCQHREPHAYTGAKPGGWSWTDLSGGVPDADDTCAALLALARSGDEETYSAAADGVRWLLDLQNRDGGWPTFCRGWGRLPFDRSAPDLTAHAIRAIAAWEGTVNVPAERRAVGRGFQFLRRAQREDGAWVPLWFGNEHGESQESLVYGTARVLKAYSDLGLTNDPPALRGLNYLMAAQQPDAGWGGDGKTASSVEETALAVDALTGWWDDAWARESCVRGAAYLAARVLEGSYVQPSPIGLYFAKLWYSERLYPMIWLVGALGNLLARAGGMADRMRTMTMEGNVP